MRRRLTVLAVAALLTGRVSEVEAQTGPYIQMDLGAALASQLVVHGSDNDWGTRCDLIINPLGLEATDECDTAPPRSPQLALPVLRAGYGGRADATPTVGHSSAAEGTMPYFILSTRPQPNGDLEVHVVPPSACGSPGYPKPRDQRSLGQRYDCHEAIEEAEALGYANVNGCPYCTRECYRGEPWRPHR